MSETRILKSRELSLTEAVSSLSTLERRLRRCTRLLALARAAAAAGDLRDALELNRAAYSGCQDFPESCAGPLTYLEIAAGEIEYRDGNLVELRAA